MASVFRKPADADRNVKATLYVGHLDPQVNEALLYELLIQFAPIRSLNLPKDRVLGTHQGYGFVEFRGIEDANYVLEILRGVRLYGKSLKLRRADPNSRGAAGTTSNFTNNNSGTNGVDVGAKLFVGNLDPLIDEQYLHETFSKFGTMVRPPVVVRDSETGESKRHGFLTFGDFQTTDSIIEKMNGAVLMNSLISIDYAFKDDPANTNQKRIRHGDKVERMLAANVSGAN